MTRLIRWKLLLLWSWIFLANLSVFSQVPAGGIPEILNFSKKQYGAGTQNWKILQDESGILYFANNKGVVVFDGTYWELVEMPNLTVVRALSRGPGDHIYVGAQDEVGYLRPMGYGQTEYHSFSPELPSDVESFEDVWGIFSLPDAEFFCSQLMILIRRASGWEVVNPERRFENFFQVDNTIYVQEVGRGLLRWQDGTFRLVPNSEIFSSGRIAAMVCQNNEILVISESKGIFRFDGSDFQPVMAEASEFLRNHKAYCAVSLTGGGYAIGTIGNGLLLIDSLGIPFLHINKDAGLQNNTVLSLLEDQQLNLWLGLDNGIDYVRINGPFSVLRSESGLDGTGYASMVFGGKMFAGTNQGLFARPKPVEGQSNVSLFTQVPGLTGQVWCIDTLGGSLVVGAHEGAFRLNGDRLEPMASVIGVWNFLLLRQNPGYAVAGTYTGLELFERAGNRWNHLGKIEGFDESARIMEQDARGDIWVSHTYKGVFRLVLSDDLRSTQTFFYDETNGLPGSTSINVSKIRGEVVFSTPAGIYYYDRESDRFLEHNNFNEALGGVMPVHRLIEDENDHIWFSAENEFGLLKVVHDGFLREEKLQRIFFNHIQDRLVDGFEHIYAYGNDVFIGTERGFLRFDPTSVPQRDESFTVLLREVALIAGKDTLSGGERKRPVLLTGEPPEFKQFENSFRFSYAAPFYQNIGHLEYRYWLEGFSEAWSAWSSRTEKEFTNIPPGDYTFHVEARNAYGTISKQTIFPLTVHPPWYASNLALAIYTLLVLGSFPAFFFFNRRKLEREKAAIYAAQNKKLEQKEAKFREEVQRSQDEIVRLRNEKLRSDNKHKTAQLASATMHLVQKGEILLKIKEELKVLGVDIPGDHRRKVKQLIRIIDEDIRLDNNWQQFEVHFDQVHEDFLRKLREAYPGLTPKDQKLCAYLRMNLTTKEIAPLLNISVRGVEIARYRLRKKLDLQTDTNLVDFIMKFR